MAICRATLALGKFSTRKLRINRVTTRDLILPKLLTKAKRVNSQKQTKMKKPKKERLYWHNSTIFLFMNFTKQMDIRSETLMIKIQGPKLEKKNPEICPHRLAIQSNKRNLRLIFN
jgi:hypothetical protein